MNKLPRNTLENKGLEFILTDSSRNPDDYYYYSFPKVEAKNMAELLDEINRWSPKNKVEICIRGSVVAALTVMVKDWGENSISAGKLKKRMKPITDYLKGKPC